MTNENRKIIFLDIDGTLTTLGSSVPPESALKAIRGAQANGHLVYLCSGRNRGMLSPLLKYGFDGYVASGGSYVVCGDRLIYDCPMSAEKQQKALRILRDHGIFCTVEGRDICYTDEGFKDYLEQHRDEPGNSELLRWRRRIETSLGIRPMSEYGGEPIYKIIMLAVDEGKLRAAVDILEENYHIAIQGRPSVGGNVINGELQDLGMDKGLGIRKVCERLNLPLENSFGYGDSMNDLEMLEVVGHSVCMANGSPAIKSIVDEVCGAVNEDGLYHSFLSHGLL